MTPAQLAKHIKKINRPAPSSDYLLEDLVKRRLMKNPSNDSQYQHWLTWLKHKEGTGHDARRIYNTIVCPPMLLWLTEVVLIHKKPLVTEAFSAANVAVPITLAARCGGIRKIIPWEMVEEKLLSKK